MQHAQSTSRQLSRFMVGGVFLFYLAAWVLLVFTPDPNISGIENNTIYFIQRILDGTPVYTDPSQSPFAVAQYNPLYYYLVAALAKVTGLHAGDVLSLFYLSRAVSLALTLLAACVAGVISYRCFGVNRFTGIMTAMLAFLYLGITGFARADSVERVCYFLSLFYFLGALGNGRTASMMIAGLLAGLAFWSKQPALLLPAVSVGWLFLKRRYKQLLPYTAGCFLVILAGCLALPAMGGFSAYYANVVKGVDNGFDLAGYFFHIWGVYFAQGGLVVFILMFAVLFVNRREAAPAERFLRTLVVCQFIVSALLATRMGASANYFADWGLLVLIACTALLPEVSTSLKGKPAAWAHAALSLAVLAKLFIMSIFMHRYLSPAYRSASKDKYAAELEIANFVKQQVKATNHTVFCNLFTPDSYLGNLLYREVVVPQNDIVSLGTYHRNVFDYTALHRQLQEGAISMIVMKEGEPPLLQLRVPLQTFTEQARHKGYIILRYKKDSLSLP